MTYLIGFYYCWLLMIKYKKAKTCKAYHGTSFSFIIWAMRFVSGCMIPVNKKMKTKPKNVGALP